jgi:hypothetical protein
MSCAGGVGLAHDVPAKEIEAIKRTIIDLHLASICFIPHPQKILLINDQPRKHSDNPAKSRKNFIPYFV